MLSKKIELLRSLIAQAQAGAAAVDAGEEGQGGIYIGGGALVIIIIIILLIALT
jgi:hypothetical protein